ncbi:uncharacterized protein EV422DRAFT_546020 [Fimicolochytrium jonesii]|uniref:uncharacterized protein n=1 Tax=Fimicolochytrium jonesii TaxID=1396493 RepID=UPI0022FE1BD9|nr:uncharacterized protein EV422DRAFT_546020 [Fimicolochytrium jonesii]KAI8816442.1 hypothetical protein EV422DRAFT_546020 [Fimicolochytrium jonesii]
MGYHRVFIGRLPRDVTRHEIRKLTRRYGPVEDIHCLSGFAFVEFDYSADARDCVRDLDGVRFAGERLQVEPARLQERAPPREPPRRRSPDIYIPPKRNDYSVTVTGLPESASWQDLKDLMRKVGEVAYADIERPGTGRVEFTCEADVEEAISKFNNSEHEGRTLTVTQNAPKWHDQKAAAPKSALPVRVDEKNGRRSASPSPAREKTARRPTPPPFKSRSRSPSAQRGRRSVTPSPVPFR